MKELLIGVLVIVSGLIVIAGVSGVLGLLTNLFIKEKETDFDDIMMMGFLTLLIIIAVLILVADCYYIGWIILNHV